MGADKFFEQVRKRMDVIEKTQMANINRAAELIADAVARDRLVYLFGAGHSCLLAQETFVRAGGLMNMQAVLDPGLDFHAGAERQGGFERMPGYASIVIRDYDIQSGDVVIVISNSGRNPVPVQFALEAKQRGATVIALTSLEHSKAVRSNDPSGKRLFEIADLVLDNACPAGDAMVEIKGMRPPVGPGSTVLGAVILNAIVVQVAERLVQRGITPLVALSGNLEGSNEYNDKVLGTARERLKDQLRHM